MTRPKSKKVKLKPCPWCGGPAALDWYAMPYHPICKAKVEICCPSLTCSFSPCFTRYIDNYGSKRRIEREFSEDWNRRKEASK